LLFWETPEEVLHILYIKFVQLLGSSFAESVFGIAPQRILEKLEAGGLPNTP
jgi:hypothetical protein